MTESVDFLKSYVWIKKEIFVNVLRKKCGTDEIVLNSFTLKAALKKGENYGSQMIRATLLYTSNEKTDENCTIIIKTGVLDDKIREMIESNGLFSKEVVVYRDVLPEVYRLLGEKNIGTMLGPECYVTHIQPSYMIFEDLSTKGFRNIDRREGLNFEHLRLCLSKLAKWHAATAVYGCTDPVPLQTYVKPLCTHKTTDFFPFFTKPVRLCAEASKSWPGFEKISEKLYRLEHTIIDKVVSMFKTTKFNVITHGDLWVNNIMYQHDEAGKPIDCLFVDFSAGFWGSPAIDIAYLLYSSSSADVFESEWSQLIKHYHNELENNLHIFDYSGNIPSLDDINREIIDNSLYAVAITTFLIGLRFLEDIEKADIQTLMGESDFMKDLIGTARYRKRMEFLLRYYDSNGLLD